MSNGDTPDPSAAALQAILAAIQRQSSLLEKIVGAEGPPGQAAARRSRVDPTQTAEEQAKQARTAVERLGEEIELDPKQFAALQQKILDLQNGVDGASESFANLFEEIGEGGAKAKNTYSQLFKITGAAENINRVVPTSVEGFKSLTAEFTANIKSGKIFVDLAKKLYGTMINIAIAADKAAASFARTTGAFGKGNQGASAYGQVLKKTERQVAIFGASHDDVGNAMGDLYGSFMNFTNLSGKQQQALTAQTVALGKLNVSSQLTAQVFDGATKSLGFTDDQLVGLTETLHATAQSIGKSTSQVVADFATVSKQLAFYGTDVVGVFQELEKQSKATGLTMEQLIGIAGEAFDTFDGAAEKVGRLNAILGGPYLNSIDMLNASESERIEMIKASMDASNQMFSDLGKYEQKAIAAALGIDVDTARRMFGELSAAEEIQIRQQEKVAETARKAQAMWDKLKKAFYSLVVVLDPLVNLFGYLAEAISAGFAKLGFIPKLFINIGVLVGGLWASFKTLGKTLKSVGSRFTGAGNTIKAAFGPTSVLGKAGTMITNTGVSIKAFGKTVSKPLTMASDGFKAVGSAMKKVGSSGKTLLKPVQAIGKGFRFLGSGFKLLLKPATLVTKGFKGLFALFKGGRAAATGLMISLRAGMAGIKGAFAGSGIGLPIYFIIAAIETLIFSLNNLWAIFKNMFKLIVGIVTFDGAKISEAFHTIMENVAMIWYKGLNALTFGLFGLIVKLTGGKEKILKIFKGLAIAMLFMIPGVNVIMGVVAAVWALKKVWAKYSDQIKLSLKIGFLPLIVTFKLLMFNLKMLWKGVKLIFKGIVFQFKMLWKVTKMYLWMMTLPFQFLWKVIKTIFGGIKDVFNTTVSSFKDAFAPVIDAFKGIGASFGKAWATIQSAIQPIKDAFASIGAAFGSMFGGGAGGGGGFLDAVFGGIKKTFGFIMNVVLIPLKLAFGFIGLAIKVFAALVQVALTPVVWLFQGIGLAIETVANIIKFVLSPIEALKAAFGGIAFVMGKVVDGFRLISKVLLAPFKMIAKFMGGVGGWFARKFMKDEKEPEATGAKGEIEKVDDVIITSSGKIIKPNKKDTIIAASPGSPLLQPQEPDPKRKGALSFANPLDDIGDKMTGLVGKLYAKSPMGMLLKAAGGMAGQALGGATGSEQGAANVKVDVNVKIGEKQLTDIIIEALQTPEAGKAISPFLN